MTWEGELTIDDAIKEIDDQLEDDVAAEQDEEIRQLKYQVRRLRKQLQTAKIMLKEAKGTNFEFKAKMTLLQIEKLGKRRRRKGAE